MHVSLSRRVWIETHVQPMTEAVNSPSVPWMGTTLLPKKAGPWPLDSWVNLAGPLNDQGSRGCV